MFVSGLTPELFEGWISDLGDFSWLMLHVFPLRWYKDGVLLKDTSKYETFSEPRSGIAVLVVKNPSNEDMGHYECEVSSERFKYQSSEMRQAGEFIYFNGRDTQLSNCS